VPAPDASVRYYRIQRAATDSVVRRARALWRDVDLANLDGSWRARVGKRMNGLVSAGQALIADGADAYLDDVLDELGIDTSSAADVAAAGFAGLASDGRSLDGLLYEPIIRTKIAVSTRSQTPMASGEASLIRIVTTQLQDASRASVAAGIAARPQVTGYVRMLNPPSCGRCSVLAGKRFRWNTGFQRHPHCDCRHIPTDESIAGDLTTDPRAYFDSLSESDQARYFTKGRAAAIREGADIGQVVNAQRGMTIAGTTREGTVRGRARGRTRLMPERIMVEAHSRADAIATLREHGYLR